MRKSQLFGEGMMSGGEPRFNGGISTLDFQTTPKPRKARDV